MPKGLISGKFNEGIGTKSFKVKFFLPRHGNEANFTCLCTFQTLDYCISQKFKQIFVGLSRLTIKDH